MPFIVLKSGKEGEEVFTSFSECSVKEEENGLTIIFSNGDRQIPFILTEDGAKLSFTSDVTFKEGEEICLTFYKGRHDVIHGLSAFTDEEPAFTRRQRFKNRLKGYKHEKVTLHKKLSFFISGRYFFDNQTITDYDVEMKDQIYITIRSDRPTFTLVFCGPIKNFYAYKESYNETIKKYSRGSFFLKTDRIDCERTEDFIKSHPDLHVRGMILDKKEYNLAFLKVEKKKCDRLGLDFICCLGKKKKRRDDKRIPC